MKYFTQEELRPSERTLNAIRKMAHHFNDMYSYYHYTQEYTIH